MAEEVRIIVYVYSRTSVFIHSTGTIGMLEMDASFSNVPFASFRNGTNHVLEPGVYGIVANKPVDVKLPPGSSDVVIVRADPMRKDPWPPPPPDPPSNFGRPTNWNDHLTRFLVPVGGTFQSPALKVTWMCGSETNL